jgi:hypothetical protein
MWRRGVDCTYSLCWPAGCRRFSLCWWEKGRCWHRWWLGGWWTERLMKEVDGKWFLIISVLKLRWSTGAGFEEDLIEE